MTVDYFSLFLNTLTQNRKSSFLFFDIMESKTLVVGAEDKNLKHQTAEPNHLVPNENLSSVKLITKQAHIYWKSIRETVECL